MRVTKNDNAVWIATHVDRIADNHNVYVNVFDADGQDVRVTGRYAKVRYGWEGMQEEPFTVLLDKPLNEAGCNIPIFPGQLLWVDVDDGEGGVSDKVGQLELYGIGSYLVHFERLD